MPRAPATRRSRAERPAVHSRPRRPGASSTGGRRPVRSASPPVRRLVRVRTARHRRPARSPAAALGSALVQAAGLALPVGCAGCGRPDLALCRPCLHALVGPGSPGRPGHRLGSAVVAARPAAALRDGLPRPRPRGAGRVEGPRPRRPHARRRRRAGARGPLPARARSSAPAPSRRSGRGRAGPVGRGAGARARRRPRRGRRPPRDRCPWRRCCARDEGRPTRPGSTASSAGPTSPGRVRCTSAGARAVAGRPVVLVDDVVTTGASLARGGTRGHRRRRTGGRGGHPRCHATPRWGGHGAGGGLTSGDGRPKPSPTRGSPTVDIVVTALHVEVPDRFRRHLEEKLAKVEQLSPRLQRIDVKISHESNPRQADTCERVELTVRARGPGDPRRGVRRRPLRRARPRPGEADGAAAPGARPPQGAPRPPPARHRPRRRGLRPRRGRPGRGRRARRRARRVADRVPREDPRRRADDRVRGGRPDGARRARLLPVLRRRVRPAERGLPAPRVELRRAPAGGVHRPRRWPSRTAPARPSRRPQPSAEAVRVPNLPEHPPDGRSTPGRPVA